MTTDREDQPAWHGTGTAIRLGTVLAAGLTLYVLGGLCLRGITIIFMKSPCQDRGIFAQVAGWMMPIDLIAALAVQIACLRRPALGMLVASCLLPACVWIFHFVAMIHEDNMQRQCIERPLGEAMRVCRADPAVYRQSSSGPGTTTITLVAPGRTDTALSCLGRWIDHHPRYSLDIDESVYRLARERHRSASSK